MKKQGKTTTLVRGKTAGMIEAKAVQGMCWLPFASGGQCARIHKNKETPSASFMQHNRQSRIAGCNGEIPWNVAFLQFVLLH